MLNTISCPFPYLEIGYEDQSEACLLKILRRQMDQTGTTFRIILETNTSNTQYEVMQDAILKTLNGESKWLFQAAVTGMKQFNFASLNTKENRKRNAVATMMIDHVLLLLDSWEVFEERVQDLLLRERVYSGFQLVVVLLKREVNYENITEYLMRTAWDFKLFTTTVVSQTNVHGEWRVYDVHYRNKVDPTKKCIDNIVPKTSFRCYNDTLRRIFLNSWSKNSKYPCSVDVVSFEYPPFVVNETSGFEIHLLRTLGEHINLNFNLLVEKDADSNWGALNSSDGSWSGRLGLVQTKSAIAVGNLRAVPSLHKHFDFSIGYYNDKFVWVVPVAQLAPRWMCIFMPFTFHLWLFCIFLIVAGGMFLWISTVEQERTIYHKLDRTFFVAFETLLGFGLKMPPFTRMTRAIFVSLAFCSMFLSSVYQGTLIRVLTHPVYQHQIKTLEEIIDTGLDIGSFGPHKEYFNNSEDAASMKIYNMFKTLPNANIYDWLAMVATHRNVATIASELYVNYLIATGDPVVVANGFPKVYVLKEVIVPVTTSILMPKGFPLQERINNGIQNIITNGVALKLTNRAMNTLQKYKSREEAIFRGKDVLVLSTDNVQGAFILLMLGQCCAIVALVFEIIFYKLKIGRRLVTCTRKVQRVLLKVIWKAYNQCKTKLVKH